MSKQITIHKTSLPVVEYQGQRVVTLAMIDQVHQRPDGTASRNFREHRQRFIEGEDFFEVTTDEIRRQSLKGIFPPRTPKGILLTESGYLMLVKSFTDDLAWEVQRQLVNEYFRVKDPLPKPQKAEQSNTGLPAFRKARALEISVDVATKLFTLLPNLSEESRQCVVAKIVNPLMGYEVISLPALEERYFTAEEVGKAVGGLSANKVGRIANANNLKTEQYGRFFLDTSQHSSKQVETFRYNAAGVEAIRQIMEVPNEQIT